MAEAANKNKPHKLIIDNRNSMSMTGVTKVISIDTDLVLLVTEQGKLKITGKNMQALWTLTREYWNSQEISTRWCIPGKRRELCLSRACSNDQ